MYFRVGLCLPYVAVAQWPTSPIILKCGARRANWGAAHLARGKYNNMEVDLACQQNVTDVHYKSSHALDPRRKQEEGTAKRDVEKVRGARDEGSRLELGPDRKAGSRQTTTAFLGVGLRPPPLCASTHEVD